LYSLAEVEGVLERTEGLGPLGRSIATKKLRANAAEIGAQNRSADDFHGRSRQAACEPRPADDG